MQPLSLGARASTGRRWGCPSPPAGYAPSAGQPKVAWETVQTGGFECLNSQAKPRPAPGTIAPAAPSTGSAAASGTFDPLCKVLFALRTVYLCAIDHRSIFVLSRDTPRQTMVQPAVPSRLTLALPAFSPFFALRKCCGRVCKEARVYTFQLTVDFRRARRRHREAPIGASHTVFLPGNRLRKGELLSR